MFWVIAETAGPIFTGFHFEKLLFFFKLQHGKVRPKSLKYKYNFNVARKTNVYLDSRVDVWQAVFYRNETIPNPESMRVTSCLKPNLVI